MRILVVAMSFFLAVAAVGETAFPVMTFNVRYGTAADGENHWEKRKDLLVDTIRQQDPVVLGVQECLVFQAEYIVEKLPDYRWIGIGRDRDGGGEMAAILYKHRQITPVAYKTIWLSKTPDEPGSKSWDAAITRVATHVKFFLPKQGRFVNVINTHFDHKGDEARRESAKLLAERVAALGDGDPVVVMGDFNARGGQSAPWKSLTEGGGLSDAWLTTTEQKGPPTTWCGFEAPQRDMINRIDWILFRNGVTVGPVETVVNEKDGRYPSDHFPVVAQLVLPF